VDADRISEFVHERESSLKGVTATYTPPGGAASSVAAILDPTSAEDRFDADGQVVEERATLLVRDDQVANPRMHASVRIDGLDWTIVQVPPAEAGVYALTLARSASRGKYHGRSYMRR